MQILILNSKFPYPFKDGGAIATYNIVKGLSNHFNKTYLLSFNTKKHFISDENIPKKLFSKIIIDNFYINTDLKPFKALKNLLFSKKPYILERFYNKQFQEKLIGVLKSNKFDIVQIEGLYLMQYVDVIKKNSNALISYRAHNIENEIWQSLSENKRNILLKYYSKNLTKRIFKYEKSVINKYNLLVPISESDADKFTKLGNNKPSITISVGFEKPENQDVIVKTVRQSLYFIGSLEWQPNTEGVLWFLNNCWINLKKKYPNLKFYIAGRNAPQTFIDKLNYKDVIFEGELENISEFIKYKRIMLVPLLSGSGMRVKIIEAFMNKKAVVSTSVGAKGTKTTNNKHLLIADATDDFINQISKLIEDDNLYNSIINNAYKLFLEKFDNFEISKQLFDFYLQQIKNCKIL